MTTDTRQAVQDRRAEYAFHDDLVYLHEAKRGLTRETVTRVLDKWKKSGEIEILRNKYIRLNDEFYSIEI